MTRTERYEEERKPYQAGEQRITETGKCDCGHVPSEHTPHTTGYGWMSVDGQMLSFCYECCVSKEREQMESTGKACLYFMSQEPTHARGYPGIALGKVSDWAGKLTFPCRYRRRANAHNWGLSRTDAWFKDAQGREWHGVLYGDNTQLMRCRRLKSTQYPASTGQNGDQAHD
jgi:hypothetical protein